VKFPEKYRILAGQHPFLLSDPGDQFGAFRVPVTAKRTIVVIATAATNPDSAGWDHVSVSVSDRGGIYNCALPTWQEMSMIKDLFWDEEECVIQFHPPKSQYVNNYNALHLWKPAQREIPQPPTWLIGTVK
jgi:hypothetical protein